MKEHHRGTRASFKRRLISLQHVWTDTDHLKGDNKWKKSNNISLLIFTYIPAVRTYPLFFYYKWLKFIYIT